MKKFISLFVIVMFGFVISACSTTKEKKSTATEVTFSSWGLGTAADNNLLRRQIAQFNKSHKDVQIKIVEPDGDWNTWLTTKAAAGEFPDVVSVANVPDYVINGWIGDISSQAKNDTEWNNIPQALRNSITYGDKIYAIPAAYHYMGYYGNLDLLETVSNADFDNFDYTDAQFFQAISDLKNVNVTDGSGTIGISNAQDTVNWMPSIFDTTGKIQQFVWDGSKFEFNSDAMKEAIAKAADLQTSGQAFQAYDATKPDDNTPSPRETIFGSTSDSEVFDAGQMGFMYDASWGASSYANNIGDFFNYDFVGLPDSRVIGVSDYYGVSATTKHQQAAYEVAKYLTFGQQGINDSFNLIDKAKTDEDITFTMPGLPLNTTQSIVDKWFNTYAQPGFKKAYELAAQGKLTVLMEGTKYVPGFTQARFNYDTGIDATISRPDNTGQTLSIGDFIYDASLGKISYSDYMTQQLSDGINSEFLKVQNQLLSK